MIRGANMGSGRYVSGEFAHVSEEKFARDLARNSATPRDIIYTQRGTLGQVAIVPVGGPDTYVVSQSQMRLRVDPDRAVPEFVYYASTTDDFLRQIQDRAISTGVPHTNLGILGELEIPLPPVRQQQAIAEVLGALDDKIAADITLADAAESVAIATVATLASTVPLATIAWLRRDQLAPAALGDVRVHHFSLPAFDVDRRPSLESAQDIKSAKFVLNSPVVLLSKLNPRFPRVWRASPVESHRALASTEFLVLEPNATSPGLLWASLSQPNVTRSLESQVSGTSGSHQRVRPSDVLATPVIDVRSAPERLRVAVEASLKLADLARVEIATLAEMRTALIPHLMSGKLSVRDALSAAGT
ncbi:restriction endonuclease subunit S [Microbacterium maritypicum]|uniref:restriction endonuclease subunit S n=1 Tax=Microbacterium maritypicum TaxID=33918 RepID=UPI001B328DE2|nr:restriction endonuclease subunit S [Microbacterium liquefaciens]MBP5803489.1 restriction endonuclease subunit S [Microbacterium liquefaciens]